MFRSQQNVSKRPRSPSADRATDKSGVKKQCKDTRLDYWIPSERFWDTLPRIHLTRRALAEHNRRNRQRDLKLHSSGETAPRQRRSVRLRRLADQKRLCLSCCAGDRRAEPEIQRFARRGGPDLTSVRGCPDPTMSNRTSRSSTRLTSSGLTKSSKRSGPYDANFQMKLAQAGIHLTEETDENDDDVVVMPANHDEIMERLNHPRESLSPSRFPEQDFQRFRRQTEQEILESETMQQSMAVIESGRGQILSRMGGPFNNLESFDPDMTMAVPDSYDGASPLSIDHRVLHDLDRYIVPSTDSSRPAVPNFFLEGKSRKGRADVAKRQAAHTGAIGARGMISLQNYPTGVTQYDGNAYSFTNTYHDGTLKMYATHARAPRTPDDLPQYYMTQLNTFAMTGNSKTFREGATYYRNAQDLAKEQRDSFIQQANQATQQTPHSRTTTNTTPSVRIHSQSREYRYSPDTNTSADELALDDSFKRSRTELPFDDEDRASSSLQTSTSHVEPASTHQTRKRRSKKTLR